MLMKKYFLLLCCIGFFATAQADTATNAGSLEAAKTQMVRQWEMPFVHLKSLQLSVQNFVTNENGKPVKRRLAIQSTFAYDDPKYLDDVTLMEDQYTQTSSKGNQERKTAFDGNYYYSFSLSEKDHKFFGERAPDIDETWPPVTLNPLALAFSFVVNSTDVKNFRTLTNPRTWDAFEKRITDFKKDPQSGDITFNCQSHNFKNEIAQTYEIKAAITNGMYFPVSIKTIFPNQEDTYSEVLMGISKYPQFFS